MPSTGQGASAHDWWRTAAIYEVYVRSFADGNGDGIGDLAGVRARLPYLAELGIDAIWFAPWYPSPMADAGYDVADYRGDRAAVRQPGRGGEADRRGARPRHQDHHRHRPEPRLGPAAVVRRCAGRPGWLGGAGPLPLPARPGRERGACRRTTGLAMFGGPAWSRVPTNQAAPTGRPAGSGICTCSVPASPTSTGRIPDVRAEFASVLRFWFDRGVDGFRIDSAGAAGQGPRPGGPRPGPGQAGPGQSAPGQRGTGPCGAGQPGGPSVHRPGRGARDLPGLAADRRVLLRGPGADRRDLAARPRAAGPLPAPGRAALGVQFRLPVLRVGRARAARGDRRHAGLARPGRRHADLGAQQP